MPRFAVTNYRLLYYRLRYLVNGLREMAARTLDSYRRPAIPLFAQVC